MKIVDYSFYRTIINQKPWQNIETETILSDYHVEISL